jgi:hypothetical protein
MADGQLTTVEDRPQQVAPIREPDQLMGALVQAAMNPDVDPDKMERMLALYERMEARKAQSDFDNALAVMLPKLPEIGKRGEAKNGEKKLYTFARWEDINRAIKPILAEHGFALTFRTDIHEKGVLVTGILSRGGHQRETSLLVPFENSGAKNDTQARGSSTSYGKRYTASALLNLVTSDEPDNDGGTFQETIGPEQMTELDNLLKATKSDRQKFFAYAKVEGMADITVKQFPAVKKLLERKLKDASQ